MAQHWSLGAMPAEKLWSSIEDWHRKAVSSIPSS